MRFDYYFSQITLFVKMFSRKSLLHKHIKKFLVYTNFAHYRPDPFFRREIRHRNNNHVIVFSFFGYSHGKQNLETVGQTGLTAQKPKRKIGFLKTHDSQPAVAVSYRKLDSRKEMIHEDYGLPAEVIVEDILTKYWYHMGKRHRGNDLPAMVKRRDDKIFWREWWVRGARHRDNDLPAVDTHYFAEWWKNGQRHRDLENGPAIINEYKIKWYVEGRSMGFISDSEPGKNEYYINYFKQK